jgi:hypothetical protein
MQKPELGKLGIISVVFETRPDGGLVMMYRGSCFRTTMRKRCSKM